MQLARQVLSISTHSHGRIPTTRRWEKRSPRDVNILNPMRTIKLIHGTTHFLGSHETSAGFVNHTRDANGVDCWLRLAPAMTCLISPFDARLVFVAARHFFNGVVGGRVHHVPAGVIVVGQGLL